MAKNWVLDMLVEPVVAPWEVSANCENNGSELQRAIVKGFSDQDDPIYVGANGHREFVFERIFNFKDNGEFFRGALTMAGLRYAGDFYELLKKYQTLRVTIKKSFKEK